MYIRPDHAELHVPTLRALVRNHPLGILTTAVPSDTHALLQCSHIPFVLDVDDEASETELGRLRGHMARRNPQSQVLIEAATQSGGTGADGPFTLETEVLVLFHVAPDHYVSPKFYVETKPTTGKVVPTWNYAAVQAYGRATIHHASKDAAAQAFLARQMRDLSQLGETDIMGYTGSGDAPGPWAVSDAPERYISLLTKNIIGIEIVLTRLEGKFKMSQEMGLGDRTGVAQGFERLESDAGRELSQVVRARSEAKAANAAT